MCFSGLTTHYVRLQKLFNDSMKNSHYKRYIVIPNAPTVPQLVILLFHTTKMVSEVGLFVWSISNLQTQGNWYVLLAPFAYRLGLMCLLELSSMSPRMQLILFFLSSWSIAAGIYTVSLVLLIPGCFVFGGILDSIRKQIMRRIKTPIENKVLGRLVAFPLTFIAVFPAIFSGFYVLFPILVFVVFRGHFVFGSISSTYPNDSNHPKDWLILILSATHTAQYFIYCYVIWFVFPVDAYPLIGIMFFSGWAGYLLGNYLIYKIELGNSMHILAAGNALSMISLILLSVNLTPFAVLVCFFLTGIGGSSSYVIARMAVAETRYYHLFETIGTVSGISACLFLVLWSVPIEYHLWLAAFVSCFSSFVAFIGNNQNNRILKEMRKMNRPGIVEG